MANHKRNFKSTIKSKNKTKAWKLLPCAALLWGSMAPTWAAVNLSNQPLAGVGTTYGPNVVLALSVEYPTAGPAYSTKYTLDSTEMTRGHPGYFDFRKCYKYNSLGFFEPSSIGGNNGALNGYFAACNLNGETNEFSGNALNFLTMSAIDIFRQTLTGGNRALGELSEWVNYQLGDTQTETYLRRANIVEEQNLYYFNGSKVRTVDANSLRTAGILARSFPISWGSASNGQDISRLEFENKGFHVIINRVYIAQTGTANTGRIFTSSGAAEDWKNSQKDPTNINCGGSRYTGFYCTYPIYGEQYDTPSTPTLFNGRANIITKVCDKAKGLESNCVQYGDNYKPEGLLQQYSKGGNANTAMRVAVMGYLNYTGNLYDSNHLVNSDAMIHGGVLRSRMKTLLNTQKADGTWEAQTLKKGSGSITVNNALISSTDIATFPNPGEWNVKTGQFYMNPDLKDAADSGVLNSGAINYLNKFGDKSGYRTLDPGAELYYTAVRYLRNGAWTNNATTGNGQAPYQQNFLNFKINKDGFPAIYDWEDPLKSVAGAQCRTNTIIYIGDTNTHQDWDLPNFDYAQLSNPGQTSDNNGVFTGIANSRLPSNGVINNSDNIMTQKALETALNYQGSNWNWNTVYNYWDDPRNADWSPAGIVGLAYWAHSFDTRPDIPGNQYIDNFMVDVVESGDHKGGDAANVKNPYYLAAKYGGYDRNLLGRIDNGSYPNPNINRASWTDDMAGSPSISVFTDGVPRNFGIANSPASMAQSLKKAFATAGAQNGVSQTDMSTVNSETNTVDLESSDNLVVRSSFNTRDWSGDVLVYSVSARTVSGSTEANGLNFDQVWSLGDTLTAAYHGTGYKNRNVFTWENNSAKKIDPNTANDLIKYILGDPTNEGTASGKYRVRNNLLGTIVNSQIVGFRTKDANGKDTGPYYFAVASNDGMLHVFKVNKNNGALSGGEVFAYIPQAAMPGLENYASQGYSHRYLNDGSLTVKTLQVGNANKTYLVGSTGRGDSDLNGKSAVYVVDITNPNNPTLLWEFNADGKLGHILGEPVVTLDKAGKPVAIVSSGYSSDDTNTNGFVYILDIANKTYQSVKLDHANVGAVTGYDSDNDQRVDRIYVGDDSGKLWRVDNTKDSVWNLPYRNNDDTWALYEPSSDHARPITGTPYAQKINGKLYVLAGTGRYLNNNDLNANQQNYAYGFIDNCNLTDSSLCKTIQESELLKQSIADTSTALTAYRNISLTGSTNNTINKERGWQISLRKGMLIAGHAAVEKNRLAAFPIVSQNPLDENSCSANGETSGLFVDIINGGQFQQPIFDTNGDGVVDGKDQAGSLLTMEQLMNPERGILHTTSGDFAFASIEGDGGIKLVVPEDKQNVIRRLSWREIF